MRIKVDFDLCQGHATCMAEAPEVFHVGARDTKVTVLAERPAEELRRKVEMAVKYCPTHALKIEED